VASRSGAILNKTDIAAPLGLSVPALGEWINILEITGQVIVVPPFYENFGKRLIKSPKIYFTDSGLVCYLLGIETEEVLRKSTFFGQIFEGFVASEIIKHQENFGKRRGIYYFRDQQGLEVDFIIPSGSGKLVIMEAKAVRSVKPVMAVSLIKLARAMPHYKVEKYVIHLNPPAKSAEAGLRALSPGVTAMPVAEMHNIRK
jgi:predicted AAA+ superfamily ATPase